ncbi:MAG: D-alanyl-D-alanine carboxypeptidase [Proteobacteria bacterium]|nr:D-alanyl-D-alanine carboxypeptidase [Pseudomonadota bacterium]
MYRLTRRAAVLLSVLILIATLAHPASARRYASVVIDADTGEVIYGRQENAQRIPASLVKMMTLYLTFEALADGTLQLKQELKVSKRAAGRAPTKLGVHPGKTIAVEDAILGLITKSANDVATVLAEALGGSEPKFARLMTIKGRKLGMKHTKFRNASGLPNRRQRSTALDMAVLARALFRDYPQYYHYFSTQQFRFGKKVHKNHNNLLTTYVGVDGIKTGYTRASGFNVAVSAKRNNRRIIGVIIGGRTARSRDNHARALLDEVFTKLAHDEVASKAPRRTAAAVASPQTTSLLLAETNTDRPIDEDANWGIQVGAFQKFAAARKQIHRAASAAPSLLQGRRVSIIAVSDAGRDLYRARLTGVTEGIAHEACAVLREQDFDCVPVPPK